MSEFRPAEGDAVAVRGVYVSKVTRNRWFVELGAVKTQQLLKAEDCAPWLSSAEVAALRRVAAVVPDLIDWMERYRGGDGTLHPEEFYIRRDEARAALIALNTLIAEEKR